MEPHEEFLAQMREATERLRTSGPAAATAAIQSALRGAARARNGSAPPTKATHPSWSPSVLQPGMSVGRIQTAPSIAEATAESATERPGSFRRPQKRWKHGPARQRVDDVEVDAPVHPRGTGQFSTA